MPRAPSVTCNYRIGDKRAKRNSRKFAFQYGTGPTPCSHVTASSDVVRSFSQMRRTLTNLVLIGMLWGYPAPAALRGSAEAELPACCRGNGSHHCAMPGMARPSSSSPGFNANSSQCPYRPLGSAQTNSNVGELERSFSPDLPATNLSTQWDFALRTSGVQIRNAGRGPPAFSL